MNLTNGALASNIYWYVSETNSAISDLNDETIVQENGVGPIEYFHFELDCHSIIMAEGVLSETFLDFDNSKNLFQK